MRSPADCAPLTAPPEVVAIAADARQRLAELRAVRDVLLPDADDAAVMSELLTVESQIAAAQRALRTTPAP